MKTIIAGTDFSASSLNACKYAAFLANNLKCKLMIFNLFEAPIIHSNMGLYGITYASQKNNSSLKIKKLVTGLSSVYPSLEINSFVTNGTFKEELEEFVKKHHVEAAVMGLEAKTKISKFIYGSNGVNIAGKINAPVIIVPENYKKHKLSKIVLAVDNNEKLYKYSLVNFENFAKKSGMYIELLHVRTEDEIFKPIANSLKINGKNKQIFILQSQDIQDGIRKYSKQNNFDIVAVIGKQHSSLYNLFVESTTKKIAFTSKVPVIAFHE